MVFAEDAQRLLPLDQAEEVVRHCLTVEEVVDAQQEVPGFEELHQNDTTYIQQRA